MNGFERRRERKKESIRQAAVDLFTKFGEKSVSVAKIAKKAKVSQVTIYNYFGSKENLYYEAIELFLDKVLQDIKELLESDLPYPQKIEQLVFESIKYERTISPEFIKSLNIKEPTITGIVENFANNRYIPLLLNFIEQGKVEGYVNKEISAEAILLYIRAFKLLKESEILTDYENKKHLSKELMELFFYGLMGSPKNSPT
ncbi:TetR/AcrR family transcriptional regulator [Desulfofalx alkaliphila]|uniref:TetR/AcrR family transcriptional regulator n=1 Tax=Desulfofalx alkaliphila TaxID=105483 RepID=UPI0004E21976|nr:TetR/AcrR family transcriptional regulator [Desulfofalx alkaliphila]